MKPSVGDSCLVTRLSLITCHYFGGLLWEAFCRGQLLRVTGLVLMTFLYFGGLLYEAFRRGQLLSNRVVSMFFHYFRRSLWEAFRREQLLGAQVTFDDISLLQEVALGSFLSGTAA